MAVCTYRPRKARRGRSPPAPPRHAELHVDVRQGPLDGPHAAVEPRGDLVVPEAGRRKLEDVDLAVAEVGQLCARGRRLVGRRGEESLELVAERPPGRLVCQQYVV